MAGILGILAFDEVWNISKFLYYGIIGLQHRGYSKSGLALLKDGKITLINQDVAPEDLNIEGLSGWAGIGYAGTRHKYPIISGEGSIVVDGEVKDNDIFAELFKDPESVIERLKAPISFIGISKEGQLIAYRDEFGLKPISIGGFGFDLAVVASEPTAMYVIGAEYKRDINPGEMIIIDKYHIESKQVRKPKKSYCAIEYIYQARIDSKVNEREVYDLRLRIGEQLAIERPLNADTVIGVPETALPFAIGYSRKLGLPMDLGFTRTGSPIRTMLASDSFLKIVGVQLKLNPIKTAVKGKRVVLIDDSMVTGTTIKNTVFNLRKLGAKEVHVLIGSPKLISNCPYGIEVPEEKELISANLNDSEIAKVLGVDSIYWLSLEGLIKVIGHNSLCLGCMTKKYPVVI
ncbi:amidophosphoribosyltransferase [Sulfolobus sp. A20]|uniref:amidophosphoribosyltransferase n=1 Tax=Sulfolobaceae TaxID=118883 RepID=UPI000845E555|nr:MULTISPECIES: amidophosphoribosyltransferase [unclassified Sulfolobus]AOL15837.1 amidophosphoribosyltransferase [Sulfolobus sp. A20]TRM81385.1 amidophosphoribosyltransferase [Sulfolobus sp. A20-N-F6]